MADYWESVVRLNEYQKRRFVHSIIEKMFHTVTDKPAFVFDGRNLLDPDALARIGFHVVPVGKKERGEFVSRGLSQN